MNELNPIKQQIDDTISELQLFEQSVIQEFDFRSKKNTIRMTQKANNLLIQSSDVLEAEQQLKLLVEQNSLLKQKMNELQSQKRTLEFELAKYREDIKLKKRLLNKEVKQGFQILSSRPRILSDKQKSKSNERKSPLRSTFLTETSERNLSQLHQLLRDVMKLERMPPLVKTNRKYSYEQFMKLSRSEYFSYIHQHLPKIRRYFIDMSYKRAKQLDLM